MEPGAAPIIERVSALKETSSYKEHNQFYNGCAQKVIEFCTEHDKSYHIKDGTITQTKENENV